jgi:hypothetical protein
MSVNAGCRLSLQHSTTQWGSAQHSQQLNVLVGLCEECAAVRTWSAVAENSPCDGLKKQTVKSVQVKLQRHEPHLQIYPVICRQGSQCLVCESLLSVIRSSCVVSLYLQRNDVAEERSLKWSRYVSIYSALIWNEFSTFGKGINFLDFELYLNEFRLIRIDIDIDQFQLITTNVSIRSHLKKPVVQL